MALTINEIALELVKLTAAQKSDQTNLDDLYLNYLRKLEDYELNK